uniref:EF-hand domain-containing protein n=1 Tax=Eutreptiella gymnastica TaxID=73025 RepID=A0A7S1JI47_9EUGL
MLEATSMSSGAASNSGSRGFTEEEIRKAFFEMDLDQDHVIGPGDLRVFFSAIGEELTDAEVDTLIRSLDMSGTGHVVYEDFRALAQR